MEETSAELVVESDKRLSLFCSASCSLLQLDEHLHPTKTNASAGRCWRAPRPRGLGPLNMVESENVIKRHRRRARGKSDDCRRTGAMLAAANVFCQASGGADVLVKQNWPLVATWKRAHRQHAEANFSCGHSSSGHSARIECADSEERAQARVAASHNNELELEFRLEVGVSRARDRAHGGTRQHLAPTIGQQAAVWRQMEVLKLAQRRRETNDKRPTIKSGATSGCQMRPTVAAAAGARQEASTKQCAAATPDGAPVSSGQVASPISTHLAVGSSHLQRRNCTMMMMINCHRKRTTRRCSRNTGTQANKRRDKQAAASDKKWPLSRSAPLSCCEQTQALALNANQRQGGGRRPSQAGLHIILLLVTMLLAAVGAASSATRRAGEPAQADHKLELWRSLVRSLYEAKASHKGDTNAELPADIKSSQLELLAQRLARWPDQRRAAPLLRRPTRAPSRDFRRGRAICRQISWAQLSEPRTSAATGGHSAIQANYLAHRVALDRLAPNRKLADHLNGEASSGQAARLALDSANLITRLLLAGAPGDELEGAPNSNPTANSESAGFFGSFLSAFKASKTGDQETGSEESLAGSRAEVDREAEELIKDTRNLELLLNRLVTPKFLRYLLAMKLREHAALTSGRPAARLLHSMGTIMFEDGQHQQQLAYRSSSSQAANSDDQVVAQKRVSFFTLAKLERPLGSSRGEPSIKFIDLLASPSGKSRPLSELPFERAPSFIARWLLADRSSELDKLKLRLATGTRLQMDADRQQLQLADGEWFSPHFDCAQGARWLLTYSAPLFAHANNGSIRFSGVSFISLDLARMGALINQCASGSISLLANTNQCRTRLVGSQCIPLAANLQQLAERQAQFRPGAYACQCPPNWPHLGPGSRAAISQRRKELIELLAGRASNDNSQTDTTVRQHDGAQQPATLLPGHAELRASDLSFVIGFPAAGQQQQQQTGALDDKRFVAQVLAANSRQNSSSSSSRVRNVAQHERQAYFALGSQLESDAALEWLSGEQASPSAATRRLCQLCKEASDNGGPPGGGTQCESQGAGGLEGLVDSNADPSSSSTAADVENKPLFWLRPLVLVVQSVCLVITLGLICVILRIRKSRLIIVSGWLMLETMLIGAVLLHTSILVRYFQPTSLTCLLEPWFRELGFSIFYGSILIKLYRILSEFQTRKAHRVCLRDKDQIIYLLAIVFIVIGYMSAWTALMVDGFFVSSEPRVAFDIAKTDDGTLNDSSAPVDILSRIERQTSGQTEGRNGASFAPAASTRVHDEKNPPLNLMELNLSPRGRTKTSLQKQHASAPWGHYATLAETSGQNEQEVATRTIRPDHLATGANLNAKLTLPTKRARLARSARSALQSFSSLTQRDADDLDDKDDGSGDREKGATGVRVQEAQESHWQAQSSKRATEEPSGSSSGSLAGEHLEILSRGLNSFGELFLGLLESEQHYEPESDTLVYLIRCRKLTWDYVTESSEIALLLFGVHLVYKLRNASMEVHKEKLILSLAIFVELLISSSLYLVRHTLWHRLTGDHLLILYSIRCQLTVTLTVALVFGPQLWQIGKSKPSLLLSALFNYSFREYNDHLSASDCGPSGGSSSGGATSTGGGANRGKRGNSTRHRCHISCEVHDHHLGDASRLQQAMLSNSALEIGSINLADMDPDEIQAELKRVYTQLELLKTKVMRRDNPHISKRRGGRKPGHRKFSLQAFHNRHSSSGEQHHAAATTSNSNEPAASSIDAGEQVGLLATARQAQQQSFGSSNQYPSSSTAGRLPALAELEGETSSSYADQRASKPLLGERVSSGTANSSGKHVRVDDTVREYTDDNVNHQTKSDHKLAANERFKAPSLTSKLMSRSKPKKKQQQQQNSRCGSNSKWTSELPSTSSLGLEEEAMMALNDSQSSGEVTPQHRSSIVYSSSYHNEEHSSIN